MGDRELRRVGKDAEKNRSRDIKSEIIIETWRS